MGDGVWADGVCYCIFCFWDFGGWQEMRWLFMTETGQDVAFVESGSMVLLNSWLVAAGMCLEGD